MMPGAYKQIGILIIVCAVLVGALIGWNNFAYQTTPAEVEIDEFNAEPVLPLAPEEEQVVNPPNINDMNPTAILETNQGVIELELFMDTMPVTAGNFISLAEAGFYNNTKFHRVIPNFMIQGGDPQSADDSLEARWGTGGPGYTIADEHIEGENLTNVRGTIAMANSGPNSGGSQFFINLVDNTFLDFDKEPLQSKHPVFGRVINGIEVVDAIGGTPTNPGDRPVEPIVIESVTIQAGQ